MRKRALLGLAATAALVLSLAPAASAATEFGASCTANRAEEGMTPVSLIGLTQNGVPSGAPVSGVVTSWKVRVIGTPSVFSQQLKVFRPTASPALFQVAGESAPANVTGGENVAATRVPIQAGDLLGLFGAGDIGALYCEGPESAGAGNTIGGFAGNPPLGSSATLIGSGSNVLLPARAVIEPDADKDGYGDETQDGCPQSALVQTACPVVVLDAFSIASGNAVKVLIATSTTAPVKVSGTVKLGKGSNAKLSAKQKTVTAGKITSFKLAFTGPLKEKLKEIGPGQKLTLKITAKATNVAGQVSTDKLQAKLKGQG